MPDPWSASSSVTDWARFLVSSSNFIVHFPLSFSCLSFVPEMCATTPVSRVTNAVVSLRVVGCVGVGELVETGRKLRDATQHGPVAERR